MQTGHDTLSSAVDGQRPFDAPAAVTAGARLRVLEGDALRRLGHGSDLDLLAWLVTGVAIALYRYTGSEDPRIATLGPDRNDPHQVSLRPRTTGDLRVAELFACNRRMVEQAFTGAEFDLAEIVERLRGRSTGATGDATVACVTNRIHGRVHRPEWCDLLIALTVDGPTLELQAEYATGASHGVPVEGFLQNLAHLLESLPTSLRQPIDELEIVCQKEREELAARNRTGSDYPRDRSVVELFEEQSALHSGDVAIVAGDVRVTYGELNARANALARLLRSQGVAPGDRVAVVEHVGVDAIVAILGILKAGGCYVPISPTEPEARIRARLTHSGSGTVLTSRRYAASLLRRLHEARVLLADNPELPPDAVNPPSPGAADAPLCVMYTSGTTGQPRGVIVSHRGVVRLVKKASYVDLEPDDRIVAWIRLDFDVSLFEIWAALLNGLTVLVCPREDVVNAERLRKYVQRHGATILWLTSPLFAELVDADPGVVTGLRTLFVGGDVVPPHHAAVVRRHHPQLRIINGYGPTENTTFSTTHTVDRDYADRVPIGRPISNSTVYIVNRALRLQPIGAVGELLVGGDGVAAGYLGDSTATTERFVSFAGERVYRTGDLGRWSPGGVLDYLGRIDDQVQVRGCRVEPAEIVARLLSHAAVRGAAVVPVPDGGNNVLAAYVVCEAAAIPDVKQHLADGLPDYLIPQYLIPVERLPLNAHGKLDRTQLPAPSVRRAAAKRMPADEIERKMAALWREVLGVEDVGADDDFFELGGHSMKTIRLIGLIERDFKVALGLQEALQSTTVAALAAAVRSASPSTSPIIEPQPALGTYQLSVSQTRLFELYERDPLNAAFNIAHRFSCGRALDVARATRVVRALTDRHDALRTRFVRSDEAPQQIVESSATVPIDVVDLSALPRGEQETRRDAIAGEQERVPFRLADAPLARIALLDYGERGFDVLWTMHHIVSDGWSMDVLATEFNQLYTAFTTGAPADLEPLPLQYHDYVHWQNRLIADDTASGRAKAFWRDQLRPPLTMLSLPYDHPKTTNAVGRRSAGYRAVIDEGTTERLRELARARRTSLFLLMFAGFTRLLAEASGARDIITGIPSANRNHHDLKNVIGFLVDSVVVRTTVDPDEPLSEVIDRVAHHTLGSLDHAYYPIELACKAADTTWPEILCTFFNMATFGDVNQRRLLDTAWYPIEQVQNAKLELVLYLSEYRNGVEVNVHYYAELFEPATIERLTRRYAAIMDAVSRVGGEVLA